MSHAPNCIHKKSRKSCLGQGPLREYVLLAPQPEVRTKTAGNSLPPVSLGPRFNIIPSTADKLSAGLVNPLSVGQWWCKTLFRATSQILTLRTMRAGSTR